MCFTPGGSEIETVTCGGRVRDGGRVRKCLKILFNFSLSLVSFFFSNARSYA